MKDSPLYDAGAIFAGGAVGGAVVSLEWTLSVLVEAVSEDAPASELALAIFMPLLVGFYALPAFMSAMVLFGWPIWAILHLIGFRSWQVAVIAGAAGAFFVSVLFMAAVNDWSASGVFWLILPGACASWTTWKLAYRQDAKPPAQPS